LVAGAAERQSVGNLSGIDGKLDEKRRGLNLLISLD
jgi:hypothetical protein